MTNVVRKRNLYNLDFIFYLIHTQKTNWTNINKKGKQEISAEASASVRLLLAAALFKKLELHSAIASCNPYASFVLSKLPACIHNSIHAR